METKAPYKWTGTPIVTPHGCAVSMVGWKAKPDGSDKRPAATVRVEIGAGLMLMPSRAQHAALLAWADKYAPNVARDVRKAIADADAGLALLGGTPGRADKPETHAVRADASVPAAERFAALLAAPAKSKARR